MIDHGKNLPDKQERNISASGMQNIKYQSDNSMIVRLHAGRSLNYHIAAEIVMQASPARP